MTSRSFLCAPHARCYLREVDVRTAGDRCDHGREPPEIDDVTQHLLAMTNRTVGLVKILNVATCASPRLSALSLRFGGYFRIRDVDPIQVDLYVTLLVELHLRT